MLPYNNNKLLGIAIGTLVLLMSISGATAQALNDSNGAGYVKTDGMLITPHAPNFTDIPQPMSPVHNIKKPEYGITSTITVCPSGCGYTSIQSAVNAVNSGNAILVYILVYSGTYHENVNVNKQDTQLTLRGIDNGGGMPVVDANGGIAFYLNSANWITIEGFKVINGSTGIYVFSSYGNTIRNNTVMNNSNPGIWLRSSSYNYLNNNNVTNNSNWGIYLDSSSWNTLSSNNVSNSVYYGIYLGSSAGNYLNNNSVMNSGWGIRLDSSSSNTLSSNNLINDGSGIGLDSSSSNTLSSNNLINDGSGIWLDSSSHNTLSSNNVSNNSDGISLWDYSSYNTIFNNYFNNTNNVNVGGGYGYNDWNIAKQAGTNIIGGSYLGGNYWSDYTGIDNDGDGLGNTLLPYTGGGQITNGGDYLPLKKVTTKMNITSWGNNVTNDQSLNINVLNNSVVRFNVTTNIGVDADYYSCGTGSLVNGGSGSSTTLFLDCKFSTVGSTTSSTWISAHLVTMNLN